MNCILAATGWPVATSTVPNLRPRNSSQIRHSARTPEARLYKTGDLVAVPAKERETLSFWGASDHQIKVRGFRIELGEIEAVLRQHDGVNETGCRGPRGHAGQPAPEVAYFVPTQESASIDQRICASS